MQQWPPLAEVTGTRSPSYRAMSRQEFNESASALLGAYNYCSLGQVLSCSVQAHRWPCRGKACCVNGALHPEVVNAYQIRSGLGLLLTWHPDSRAATACSCSQSLAHRPSGHPTGPRALRYLLQIDMASESECMGHKITKFNRSRSFASSPQDHCSRANCSS